MQAFVIASYGMFDFLSCKHTSQKQGLYYSSIKNIQWMWLKYKHSILGFDNINFSNFFTSKSLIMHFVSKPVKILAMNTQKNSKYCPRSVEEKALKKFIRFNSQNNVFRELQPRLHLFIWIIQQVYTDE